jgi:hypothetical protein
MLVAYRVRTLFALCLDVQNLFYYTPTSLNEFWGWGY